MQIVRVCGTVLVFLVAALASQGSREGVALSRHPSSQAEMAETPEAAPAPAFLKGAQWQWWPDIQDAARRGGVDPVAWAGIVSIETSGNPLAVGAAGELGLSQYQAGIISKIGSHCVSRWADGALNLRCGAAWYERVRRPFVVHGPRRADLLGMIAYHSGMMVYDSEAALLRGDDPCDWTDRSYCITWRDRIASASNSDAEGVTERREGVVDSHKDRRSPLAGAYGRRAD
ncbi:MAG: hypothetical protein IPH08_03960 [Rhodocyclaceae bacterium]|nr:hypothetical protein [Rhodocyclaceae bacterium]